MSGLEGIVGGWNSLAEEYRYFPKAETVKKGLIITGIALVILLSAAGIVFGAKVLAASSISKELIIGLMMLVNLVAMSLLLKRMRERRRSRIHL